MAKDKARITAPIHFAAWLQSFREARRANAVGSGGSDVPCGECTGCCRSSLFIHIKPNETDTLRRIPKALLFPAPGLPRGNVLMGYDEQGRCPMFVDERCSIYEHRPQTCRDFDCRVFAATGIEPDIGANRLIPERVRAWEFEYANESDRETQSAIRAAAAFLRDQKDLFPPGALPTNPSQLAILAIQVHDAFLELRGEPGRSGNAPSDTEIAQAVLKAIDEMRGGDGSY